MSNYNIKELREKLDKCKNMDLKDVSLDDALTRVLKNLYR